MPPTPTGSSLRLASGDEAEEAADALEAERVAEREGVAQSGAETTGEVLAGREGLDASERREQMDHMPGQMPSHTMEM